MSDGYINGKPDVGWWLKNIHSGERFRKKYAQEAQWAMWRNYYRGNWAGGVLPKNLYFKMLRTLVPRVYYRNPAITVNPAMPGIDNVVLAKLLERVDNKLIVRMGLKEQMKRIVQNAIMFGTGVGKLGFGAEFTPTPDMLSGTEAPKGGTEKRPKDIEYNDLIKANSPWFMSVHTGRFVVPSGAMDLHSARWVANKVTRSLYDVQSDKRLKNTSDLKAGVSALPAMISEESIPEPVDLWEIRDSKTKRVIVISPNGDSGKRILYDEEDDLQINRGFPYYPLIFNMDDEVFWGVPDSQIIDPLQREANETRTLIMKHRRASIAKILAKKGVIHPDEESKLIDGNVKAIIDIDGELSDVKELPQGGIPVGLLQSETLTDQEVQEILGLGVNQFGEYSRGSADRSATEASIVNQATQIRVDERRDAAADMLVAVTTDMHYVMFAHWSEEQVIDIAGPDGVPIWVKFRPDMLRHGHYEVKVDPDSSLPETKQLREQKAVQFYQIAMQNPMIDPEGLTRFLINSFYGVQFDNLLLKAPPPQTSPGNPMDVKGLIQHLQSAAAQKGK